MRYHRNSPKARKKGILLAKWLNHNAKTDAGRKVLSFIAGVHELHDLQRNERRRRAKSASDPHGWRRAEKLIKAQELAEKLNGEWQEITAPLSFVSLAFYGSYIEEFIHTRLYDNREAVPPPLVGDALQTLITENLLARVRQCLWCKRWIFAVKESQKCCSTRCRLAFHTSSPEYKARHARAMRVLRAAEKEREFRESNHQWQGTITKAGKEKAKARRGHNSRRAKPNK